MIKINDNAIKTPQQFRVAIVPIEAISQNALGETLVDRVAVKREIPMEYGPLTNVEISAILTAVASVFFSVDYPDPVTGVERTMIARVKECSAPMYNYLSSTPLWEGLTLTLVEK